MFFIIRNLILILSISLLTFFLVLILTISRLFWRISFEFIRFSTVVIRLIFLYVSWFGFRFMRTLVVFFWMPLFLIVFILFFFLMYRIVIYIISIRLVRFFLLVLIFLLFVFSGFAAFISPFLLFNSLGCGRCSVGCTVSTLFFA